MNGSLEIEIIDFDDNGKEIRERLGDKAEIIPEFAVHKSEIFDAVKDSEILNLIKNLCLENNLAVLAALHDLNLASQYCDRLVLINDGRVHAQGTPSEVITPQNIKDVYGADSCVYTHPVNGLPSVLVSANNSQAIDLRKGTGG
jgi:ABC-type sulfate/molybdate transport systems ATPase subunit